MSKSFTFANPNIPASKKQTFAIWCLRKKLGVPNPTGDVRTEGLTVETASNEIKRLVALAEAAKNQVQVQAPAPVKSEPVVFTTQNGSQEIAEVVF
tara:strand:+ start:449 stop:736 length:288 start_codon:yes stop_codon:yes gene_type:complete